MYAQLGHMPTLQLLSFWVKCIFGYCVFCINFSFGLDLNKLFVFWKKKKKDVGGLKDRGLLNFQRNRVSNHFQSFNSTFEFFYLLFEIEIQGYKHDFQPSLSTIHEFKQVFGCDLKLIRIVLTKRNTVTILTKNIKVTKI